MVASGWRSAIPGVDHDLAVRRRAGWNATFMHALKGHAPMPVSIVRSVILLRILQASIKH